MTTCNICCEKFNKSTRLEVKCMFCDFPCCRNCFTTYLLDSYKDPHCMGCRKEFTKEFLTEVCTAVFVNKDLKIHQQNVLFEREMGLLIETMPYVELTKTIEENNKVRRSLEHEMAILNNKLAELRVQAYRIDDFNGRIIQTINSEEGINGRNAILPGQSYEQILAPVVKKEIKEVKKFVRHCPSEGCRGFLNTNWTCAICEIKTCKECNEPLKENHICDPLALENMKFINKDSKPCPECGEFIFRIEGCYMMWCTACNTPWDWKTGEKINSTENIHNPHYFDFLRKNAINQNNLNIPQQQQRGCLEPPRAYEMVNLYQRIGLENDLRKFLDNIFLSKSHIAGVEIHLRTPSTAARPIVKNRNLRIKYLLKEITDEDFKIEIRQHDQKIKRNQEFSNVYQMFVNVCNDTFMNIWTTFNNNPSHSQTRDYIRQQKIIFENLINYFNEHMEKLGKMYKCVYPGVGDTGKFYKNIVKGI
jgi:hypothetical protein